MKQSSSNTRWLSLHVCQRSIFALVIALLSCSALTAQEPNVEKPTRFGAWIDGGIGVGVFGVLPLNVGLTAQINRTVISLHNITTIEQFFGDAFNDTRLTVGWAFESDKLFLSGGTGIALVSGSRSNGLFAERTAIPTTVGLPIDIQAGLRPTSFIGLAFHGFATINAEQPIYGVTLNLQAGKFVMGPEKFK